MKLFISGQKNFVLKELPPVAKKVKAFLDASKDGELFETNQLAGLIGSHEATIKDGYLLRILPNYSYLITTRRRYWGKPRTIQQLIKETK